MIAVDFLTRTYGRFTAGDDVTFVAGPGRVTAFLGPNGAGKSTTMQIIVGLTTATFGTATITGRRYIDLPNPGREVGVLLDASAQHAGRTGRETLTIAARYMGLPRARVEGMLDMVGLNPPEASRRVRDYSLGMRQRLGLATALLGGPEVLILDEPANGLDPAGIRWLRTLPRGHADRGGTVLLSSHLIHEIGQLVGQRLRPLPQATELRGRPRAAPMRRTDARSRGGVRPTHRAPVVRWRLAPPPARRAALAHRRRARPGSPRICSACS